MGQRYLVPAVKRAFDVIEVISANESGLTIAELQRQLELPLSSVATIIYTLRDLGYLERDGRGSRYNLSSKLMGVARRGIDRQNALTRCHDLLEELARESGLTAHSAIMRGSVAVYVDRVSSESFVQFSSFVGMRWPLHSSAVGKALLAFLPDQELDGIVSSMKLDKLTRSTITSKHALKKQLQTFRRLGYTWETNEGEMGVGCVGAPVFGPDHQVVAAVSVTGTTHKVSKTSLPALGALVKRYTREMSLRLGDQDRADPIEKTTSESQNSARFLRQDSA